MSKKKQPKAVKTTALTVKQQTSPDAMIMQGIHAGVDVGTMERLVALRREVRIENGIEAFNLAMSAFQSELPIVKKMKAVKNKDGTHRYSFAPLDFIVEQVRPYIQKYRFSYTIDAEVEDKWVKATCRVTHEMGHSSTSTFKVPVDAEAYMTNPQKFASALTFAKRYAFCNAFGILTGDNDTDAIEGDKPKGGKPKTSMTVEEKFETAKQMIAACQNTATIKRYYKDISEKGPKIYSEEQVAELLDLLMKKGEELREKK